MDNLKKKITREYPVMGFSEIFIDQFYPLCNICASLYNISACHTVPQSIMLRKSHAAELGWALQLHSIVSQFY